jgi:thiamine pyrophosphokinase
MAVLLLANGDLGDKRWVEPLLVGATAVLAADGGANHLLRMGRLPDMVIGDLDSVGAESLRQLQAAGVAIQQYPAEKDETDLELALLYAVQQFPDEEIWVLGVLGGRLDQTLANILLLAHPALLGKRVKLVEEHQRAWLVRGKGEIVGRVGDTVSLVPLGGDVVIAETVGLKWQLRDETLSFGPARGVSNVLTAVSASIRLHQGALLCIHTDQTWGR